jgi:hypothetical protein
MLSDKIGAGITIGAKTTVNGPKGARVLSVGLKVVDEGIAIGMQIEKGGKRTDYAATFDVQSLTVLALGMYNAITSKLQPRVTRKTPDSAQGAEGVPGEEKGYVP